MGPLITFHVARGFGIRLCCILTAPHQSSGYASVSKRRRFSLPPRLPDCFFICWERIWAWKPLHTVITQRPNRPWLRAPRTGVGGGGAGDETAPQKFWFDENADKIPQNPGKISENLRKLPENLSKNGGQHALIWKQWLPNWHEELFLEVTSFEVFFGQVWENPGKIPSHPPKFARSYTYGPAQLLPMTTHYLT